MSAWRLGNPQLVVTLANTVRAVVPASSWSYRLESCDGRVDVRAAPRCGVHERRENGANAYVGFRDHRCSRVRAIEVEVSEVLGRMFAAGGRGPGAAEVGPTQIREFEIRAYGARSLPCGVRSAGQRTADPHDPTVPNSRRGSANFPASRPLRRLAVPLLPAPDFCNSGGERTSRSGPEKAAMLPRNHAI
jgi:hypothetical protein